MTESKLPDELSLRYQEACAQDSRRPSERVRAAVHAHAAMLIGANQENLSGAAIQKPPAANETRWQLSLLASIALLGLTALLVLQFDRGTPEEQELGLGRPSANPSPAPEATVPPLHSPAVKPAKDSKSAKEVKHRPPVGPAPEVKQNQSETQAFVIENRGDTLAAERGLPSPVPTPVPTPMAATASAKLADAANAGPSAIGSVEQSGAGAAALRQRLDKAEQQTQPAEKESLGTKDLTEALHESARAGQVLQIERLLKQGALINAPDAAGRTPLILAAMNGHTALVVRLLALGANPALTDRDGLTALQHAHRLGHQQIADLLGE